MAAMALSNRNGQGNHKGRGKYLRSAHQLSAQMIPQARTPVKRFAGVSNAIRPGGVLVLLARCFARVQMRINPPPTLTQSTDHKRIRRALVSALAGRKASASSRRMAGATSMVP